MTEIVHTSWEFGTVNMDIDVFLFGGGGISCHMNDLLSHSFILAVNPIFSNHYVRATNTGNKFHGVSG